MKEKINLRPEVIKDIAQNLEMGMACWYHITSGKVLRAPDRMHHDIADEELWEDVFKEVEEKMHESIAFECLDTHESFRVMESFAENEVGDKVLQAKLVTALTIKKPFRNFKFLIDNSDYREAWFAFKEARYIEHVKEQLVWYNRKDDDEENEL